MSYATVEDDEARCPASKPTPCVSPEETIARLLHSKLLSEDGTLSFSAFQIDHLRLIDKKGSPADHLCGESGGVSIQRCPPLDEGALVEKARSIFDNEVRRGKGAVLGDVNYLRDIRVDGFDQQVVFIIADGSDADAGHAVMRLHPDLPATLHKKVREMIWRHFERRPVPDPRPE